MSSQMTASLVTATDLPTNLEMLCSTAVTVLNAHVNDAGLCPVCGCAWPCERVVLAEHNLAVL